MAITPTGPHTSEYWYSCADVAGRPAKGAVIVRQGEVAVMVPPGCSAVFGIDQLEDAERLWTAVSLGIQELRRQAVAKQAGS
ncbi:MAG: hypothetical protein ACRDRL_00825 [Sciscionella sp.]